MSTQDIVEEYLQKQRAEGFAEAVIALYRDRFGAPPADVAARIAQTHDRATLLAWLELEGTGTAEEVLAAIRSHAAS